jgi:hypothetical protein
MVLLLDDLIAVLNNFPYTAKQLQVGALRSQAERACRSCGDACATHHLVCWPFHMLRASQPDRALAAACAQRSVVRSVLQQEIRAYSRAVVRLLTGKRSRHARLAGDPNGREQHYYQ